MKTLLKQIFALAMVFCLLAALGATAYAETKSTSVSATVGREFNYSETITDAISSMELRGECPGLTFGGTAQGFTIFGTPTTVGTYTLQTIVAKTAGGSDTYAVTITVSADGDTGGSTGGTTGGNTGSGEQAVIVAEDGKPKTNDGKVAVTKHPTGETVDEGGSAKFIARADNAASFNWGLYNPATDDYYTAAQAGGYFAGLAVEVLGDASDTTLILSNIPYSLNGWLVEARFFGADKTERAFSNGARITVTGGTLPTPSITSQPKGAELERGKNTTLSVTATTAAGTLHYQWYKNDTNKNSGGTAINGATSSSYTPPETTGTTYYYVNVWGSNNTQESTHVNSQTAAVTYPAANTGTAQQGGTTQAGGTAQQGGTTQQSGTTQQDGTTQQSGTTQTDNDNSTATPAHAVVTTAEPDGVRTSSRSHSTIIILILVLAAVLLAACVSLYILRRSAGQDEE